ADANAAAGGDFDRCPFQFECAGGVDGDVGAAFNGDGAGGAVDDDAVASGVGHQFNLFTAGGVVEGQHVSGAGTEYPAFDLAAGDGLCDFWRQVAAVPERADDDRGIDVAVDEGDEHFVIDLRDEEQSPVRAGHRRSETGPRALLFV